MKLPKHLVGVCQGRPPTQRAHSVGDFVWVGPVDYKIATMDNEVGGRATKVKDHCIQGSEASMYVGNHCDPCHPPPITERVAGRLSVMALPLHEVVP